MRINQVNFLLRAVTSIVCLLLASFATAAQTPVFTITATTPQPQQIAPGTIGTANFNVKNTSPTTLTESGVVNLPQGVTQVVGAGLCGSTFTLTPGQSCNLQLSINSDELANGQAIGGPEVCNTPSNQVYCSKPCDGDELHVTLTAGPTPPVGDVIVTPNTDPANQHLGYRAINVQNNTTGGATIDSVTFTGVSASQEHFCAAGVVDPTCFFQTTCTNPIPASGSCVIWIKALQSGALGSTPGVIHVTIDGTDHTLNTTYLLQLLAGAGDIWAWDNTSWTDLGIPTGDQVTSLVQDQAGDLLFAGRFSFIDSGNAIKNIGRYNGTSIFPLAGGTAGPGVANGRVYRSAVDPSNNVYVGGLFTSALDSGGGSVADTACLAKFDNTTSQWVSLGAVADCSGSVAASFVSSLSVDPATSDVYAVGVFSQIGAVAGLANIARWDGATWNAITPGLSGVTDVEGYVSNFFLNHLFVGGFGSIVAGGPTTSAVAQWDVGTASWPSPNMQGGLTGSTILAITLANDSSRVYAGGQFDTIVSGGATTSIAGWDPVLGDWRAFSGIPSLFFGPSIDALAIDPSNIIYGAFSNSLGVFRLYQGDLALPGTVAMSLMATQIPGTPQVTSLLVMPSFIITP